MIFRLFIAGIIGLELGIIILKIKQLKELKQLDERKRNDKK